MQQPMVAGAQLWDYHPNLQVNVLLQVRKSSHAYSVGHRLMPGPREERRQGDLLNRKSPTPSPQLPPPSEAYFCQRAASTPPVVDLTTEKCL
eukprot:3063496-Rhodomonas_salina.1